MVPFSIAQNFRSVDGPGPVMQKMVLVVKIVIFCLHVQSCI